VIDSCPPVGGPLHGSHLALVNGNPAVVYGFTEYNPPDPPTGDVFYCRAASADGSTWASPVVLDSEPLYRAHLLNGESGPMVSYFTWSDVVGQIDYWQTIGLDQNGGSWGAPFDPLSQYEGFTTSADKPVSSFDLSYGYCTNAYNGRYTDPEPGNDRQNIFRVEVLHQNDTTNSWVSVSFINEYGVGGPYRISPVFGGASGKILNVRTINENDETSNRVYVEVTIHWEAPGGSKVDTPLKVQWFKVKEAIERRTNLTS